MDTLTAAPMPAAVAAGMAARKGAGQCWANAKRAMGAMRLLALENMLMMWVEEFFAGLVALNDEEMCVLETQLYGGPGRLYTWPAFLDMISPRACLEAIRQVSIEKLTCM